MFITSLVSGNDVPWGHRRISGRRFSPANYFSGGEKRRPEIRLCPQASNNVISLELIVVYYTRVLNHHRVRCKK